LYSQGFLTPLPNDASDNQLWECFKSAFYKNKKGQDGRIRILSIVANEFTHAELEERLSVSKLTYFRIKKYKIHNKTHAIYRLDENGAIIVADYKIKILPQSA
jgi:hypothetical protein